MTCITAHAEEHESVIAAREALYRDARHARHRRETSAEWQHSLTGSMATLVARLGDRLPFSSRAIYRRFFVF